MPDAITGRCHELKTAPAPYAATAKDMKRAEFRRNDRDFQVGDELLLMEYEGERRTGRWLRRFVTHVQPGGEFGIPEGFCVLSISSSP